MNEPTVQEFFEYRRKAAEVSNAVTAVLRLPPPEECAKKFAGYFRRPDSLAELADARKWLEVYERVLRREIAKLPEED